MGGALGRVVLWSPVVAPGVNPLRLGTSPVTGTYVAPKFLIGSRRRGCDPAGGQLLRTLLRTKGKNKDRGMERDQPLRG